ncbi:A-kinase anchor protein 10, mitochondrial [Lutzomyia longipalpis]|uniref:A-kinase anchor protein 10, mitochondrial n=1 Tax=Lutzomyia longipalpis TaxID=7200 RepID=UPI0024833B12|nr:A-kinase anchor protein 10, mitochondrial [Lutzomyia longipalpis]
MLKIFKKSGRGRREDQHRRQENPKVADEQKKRHSGGKFEAPPTTLTESEKACEGAKDSDEDTTRSRLSKNLLEILSEKSSLCYFVQFLEERKGLPLIKFWLDVESFRTSAQVCDGFKYYSTPNSSNYKTNTKSTSSEGCDDMSCFSVDYDDSVSIGSERFSTVDGGGDDGSCDIRRGDDGKSTVSDDLSGQLSKITDFIENPEEDVASYSKLCDISTGQLGGEEKARNDRSQEGSTPEVEGGGVAGEKMRPDTTKVQTCIATDAVRIFRKYFTSNSPYWIDIPAPIHAKISLALCTEDTGAGFPVSPYCFEDAQKCVFSRLEMEHLNDFLDSVFYCKYCVDVVTGEGLQLRDILHSESALFYFLEFLEQENMRDYLDFWVSATNFRRQFAESGDRMVHAEAQSDAMVLYEKYFSLQANTSLQFSDAVRFHVEERICSQTEPIFTCFDHPVRIVEHFLNANYFGGFIKSQLFYKYLSELLNRIQEHKRATGHARRSHRKTFSDCSGSISTQNTLLAMETPQKHRAVRSSSTSDMQIDSRHISDPDLLWRRSSLTHGLSFGRINALGRYERDFEMENGEDRWSLSAGGSKLKKAMRKLVNLPEDKVQEEIAWQVAEMIVKDITNITLNHDTKT